MRIGDTVYIRGTIDEIRKDVVIISNKGGYFGTVPEEIQTDIGDFSYILWLNSRNRAFNEVLEIIDKATEGEKVLNAIDAIIEIKAEVLTLKGGNGNEKVHKNNREIYP